MVAARGRRGRRRRKHGPGGGWWNRRRAVAAGLALLLGAAALIWLLWPFWQLRDRFGTHAARQPSRLYGRSEVLRAGETYGRRALVRELELLGYREREAGTPRPGEYRSSPGKVETHLREFPTPWGWNLGGPLEARFRGERIAALVWRGAETQQVLLEPPVLASFYGPDGGERRPVTAEELPEPLVRALLAAEDATFFSHQGLSLRGMARAAWVNLRRRELTQGGSTLTQQLVKNLYLTHDKRVERKLREALIALLIDLRYSKRAILEAYVNEIYLGRSGSANLFGVGAAAWAYFGKEVAELDLCEAALLAGIIRSPGNYDPQLHPERALERRDLVLERMGELGWLEPAALEAALAEPLCVSPQPVIVRRAPYYVERAVEEAAGRFGLDSLGNAGYSLLGTLDWSDQRAAEKAVVWGLEALAEGWEKGRRRQGPLQAALVALEPGSGAVRAWVGGRDWAASQFDRAAKARRQPGSAFKPVVHAAAYERRAATPATLLEDQPLTVALAGRDWSPQNSDGQFRGWVTARTAMTESLNVPTARLAMHVGLEPIVDTARSLGLGGRLEPVPSLALGAFEVTPVELATVYATLMNGGSRPTPRFLEGALDPGREPLRAPAPPAPERVLSAATAHVVVTLMRGVLDEGTAVAARRYGVREPLAGKTGTSNERRDSWFAGGSPDRVALVWVGYDSNEATRLSGARAALPIWARYVHESRPPGGYARFRQPPGITTAAIDPLSGGLATGLCPRILTEVFVDGTEPDRICYLHGDPRWGPEGLEAGERERRERRWRWLRRLFGRKRQN